MIPANYFTPLTGLDSYFAQLPVQVQVQLPVVQVQVQPPVLPVQVQVQPPVVQVQAVNTMATTERQRIPVPTMRWAARPAQAIGMLSDNPCAACPHA